MRTVAVAAVLAAALAPASSAEMLPSWELEKVCLRARLIVEARRVEAGVVEILHVHHGDAKVGERLVVGRFEDLPRLAFADAEAAQRDWKQGAGIPLEGCVAVLFLKRSDVGWEPVGLGSGVRWIAGGRVFRHSQLWNPGPYFVLPDPEADSPDALQRRIAAELERRRAFEARLADLDAGERVRALLPYALRQERDAYSGAAFEEIVRMGQQAGPALLAAAEKAPAEESLVIVRLLGRTQYQGALGFLAKCFRELTPHVDRLPVPLPRDLSREDDRALERWRMLVWCMAACSAHAPGANGELRAALTWASRHKDRGVLESATRGLAEAPEPESVDLLAAVLDEWPRALPGARDLEREALVRAIGAHRLPACVPVLARLLDDSDPEVASLARSGLRSIAGKDLGARPGPWLDWLRDLAAPEAPPK
jgi:hypothetical protein